MALPAPSSAARSLGRMRNMQNQSASLQTGSIIRITSPSGEMYDDHNDGRVIEHHGSTVLIRFPKSTELWVADDLHYDPDRDIWLAPPSGNVFEDG
jgi:hypothetical protein